jgi:medium-chain acyl-[acyl-carrier-protein] hydrolase
MEFLLPIIRADFSATQTYVYTPEEPLECPVSAFGGVEDREAGRAHLEAWREQTHSGFSLQMFRGDHFFVHDARPLLQVIAQQLQQHL